MKVCVIGLGYVGMTLSTVLAENGFSVIGIETSPTVISYLKNSKAHFFEPGLNDRLRKVIDRGSFKFYDSLSEASELDDCSRYIITVGTPLDDQKRARMTMVRDVSEELSGYLKEDDLVILRSTVVIGTTQMLSDEYFNLPTRKVHVAFCPERTLEGNALFEIRTLPQIVGGVNKESTDRAVHFFEDLTNATIKVSSSETAELIKLMDNSYRDAFFAFGNQLAQLSDAIGLDAHEIVKSANFGYPRTNLAFPGLVGGPCLSKDPIILSESVVPYGAQSSLSDAAREINVNTTLHVARIIARVATERSHTRMLVTGLAFKGRPVTDDLRGSPTLELLQLLQELCPALEIKCHDFEIGSDVIENKGMISGKLNIDERFDILVIANNHPRYSSLENSLFEQILPAGGLLYDLWGVTKESWPKSGPNFTVMGLGWRL